MSNETLRDELSNDPLGRGYSAMTDSEVADDLNTEYRNGKQIADNQGVGAVPESLKKNSISGSDLYNKTDPGEFDGLNNANQNKWLAQCAVDSVDPFNSPAVNLATNVFSSGSTTLVTLDEFRYRTISRAEELGLGVIKAFDVRKAREQLA